MTTTSIRDTILFIKKIFEHENVQHPSVKLIEQSPHQQKFLDELNFIQAVVSSRSSCLKHKNII